MTTDLLGYTEDGEPIWTMYGADDDDTGDDDGNTDDDGDDDSDDDTDDADDDKDRKHPPSAKDKKPAKKATATAYKPPSEAEWRRTQAALKKANEEQRAARKAALEKAKKEGMDEAAAKAREEAAQESEKSWHPRAVRAEARAMLAEASCKNPARLLKLIDVEAVTWEGNEPLGLEGQIETLKEEWPELFATAESTNGTKPKVKKEVASAKKQGAAAGSTKKDEGEDKKDNRGAALIAARLGGSAS